MRAGRHYACPQCGEETPFDATCFRCDIPPVDENGNRPPPTFERELLGKDAQLTAGALGFANRTRPELLVLGLVAAGATHVVSSLAREVCQLNARRRLRRGFASATTPIGSASPGSVHVRGEVEIVQVTTTPDGDEVGLYLWRKRMRQPDSVETRLGCGVLLERDETGVVLLDDDFFQLLPPPGQTLKASGDDLVQVRAGDTIEVLGPVERRPVGQLSESLREGPGSYREAGSLLAFAGSSDALLTIRPLPTPE